MQFLWVFFSVVNTTIQRLWLVESADAERQMWRTRGYTVNCKLYEDFQLPRRSAPLTTLPLWLPPLLSCSRLNCIPFHSCCMRYFSSPFIFLYLSFLSFYVFNLASIVSLNVYFKCSQNDWTQFLSSPWQHVFLLFGIYQVYLSLSSFTFFTDFQILHWLLCDCS